MVCCGLPVYKLWFSRTLFACSCYTPHQFTSYNCNTLILHTSDNVLHCTVHVDNVRSIYCRTLFTCAALQVPHISYIIYISWHCLYSVIGTLPPLCSYTAWPLSAYFTLSTNDPHTHISLCLFNGVCMYRHLQWVYCPWLIHYQVGPYLC